MIPVQLTVNGRVVAAEIEPRQHLADFVREELLLTGTHLGCEHGVCGACTVLIDGAPARSCIAFPVALDGAAITTIEGFAADPVMARLREAFSTEHALQCGFCTPGMLIMARDIVLRCPGADAATIRHELAGNLCRCTGYLGIVRAVQAVAAERRDEAPVVTSFARTEAAPTRAEVRPAPSPPRGEGRGEGGPVPAPPEKLRNPVELAEHFRVPAPPQQVWDAFQQPARVIGCLPGARLVEVSADGRRLVAEMAVKLGPMGATFRGAAELAADPDRWSGTIHGQGVDTRGGTRVQAVLAYRLDSAEDGAATDVHVEVAYALQGPLAQMGRGAIARDLAARLTKSFSANLAAALGGGEAPAAVRPLDAGTLAWAMLRDWVRRLFGRG